MKHLWSVVVCVLVCAPHLVFADDCTLPPIDTNPYSRQAGIGSDNPYSLWKSDSHTFNPYSSTSGSGENIYHEAMQATDEPGYWVVKTYPIDGGLNMNLQFDGHVSASQVDAAGKITLVGYGQLLELDNHNKAPVYFNYTTAVLNDKLMPGESRKINLGIYQPKDHSQWKPYTVPLTIKYWVSTGVAPPPATRCGTNSEFYLNVTSSQATYNAAKKYISWKTYTVIFSEAATDALNGKPATSVQFIGPISYTRFATPLSLTQARTNTGRTVVLLQCDGWNNMEIYKPGQSFTHTTNHDGAVYHGWLASTFNCRVAVAAD